MRIDNGVTNWEITIGICACQVGQKLCQLNDIINHCASKKFPIALTIWGNNTNINTLQSSLTAPLKSD